MNNDMNKIKRRPRIDKASVYLCHLTNGILSTLPGQIRSGSFYKTPSSPRPCLLVYSVLYDNINQTALSPTSRNHPYKKCNNIPSIFNNAGTRGACGMCCVAYDNDNLHSSLKSPDPRLQYLYVIYLNLLFQIIALFKCLLPACVQVLKFVVNLYKVSGDDTY